ncbi:MAG: pyridoxal phosphate-dependent aminotransferase [Candidatus Eiseniibacteriota bacterium]
MPHPADHHIAWARIHPARHRHRLCDSEVEPPDLEALGLPSRVPLPRGAVEGPRAELERALARLWNAPGGRVVLAAGGSEANAVVFGALLERGDEVLVEWPGYEPHREVPRLFDIAVRRFERPPEGAPLAPAVEAALSPASRMVVLTHPHNPSGVALTADDIGALEAIAARRRLWILCDEIFRDALAEPRGTVATIGPRWVATSSLAKVYGLGGWRLGWIAGSDEVLARCVTVQNALSASPALPSIALALELVPHLDALRARSQRILADNRAHWTGLVRDGVPFASPTHPLGTTAWGLFPSPGEGDAFAAFASRRFSLAVTPGRFFGDPRGIRIGLGPDPARFAPALDTLRRALAAHTAGEGGRETAEGISHETPQETP